RHTDDPTQTQLLAREVAFERDESKALRLQLDLTAVDIDARVDARFVLAHRLVVYSASCIDLGFRRIHTRRHGNNLQIRTADGEDDEIAAVANAVRRRHGDFLG